MFKQETAVDFVGDGERESVLVLSLSPTPRGGR